jgi:hypothetical protein
MKSLVTLSAVPLVVLSSFSDATLNVSPRQPPIPTLAFRTTTQVAEAFGSSPGAVNGDGCVAAESYLKEGNAATSHLVFDGILGKIRQDNAQLSKHPTENLTNIGRWDLSKPQEWDLLTSSTGQLSCQTEPLPLIPCPNGTKQCPPKFGTWGGLNPFTSVLGMWYPNTTKLAELNDYDLYQLTDVQKTLIPNDGCSNPTTCTMKNCNTCLLNNNEKCTTCPCDKCLMNVNITRNYTYTVAKEKQTDGTRQLMRFQWTQGIPFDKTGAKAKSGIRDCFIFDWRKDWAAGVKDNDFAPPNGITCN